MEHDEVTHFGRGHRAARDNAAFGLREHVAGFAQRAGYRERVKRRVARHAVAFHYAHPVVAAVQRRPHEVVEARIDQRELPQESPFLEEWLSAQRYDLGLTEHGAPPPGTRLTPLLEVDEVCVLPDRHPLLKKRAIELKDFADQAFISLSSSDPYRLQIDEVFAQAGIARRQLIETPTAVSVCSFVRQRLGIAIVNPLTAVDFADRHLHIRPLTVSLPFRVSVIHPEHRPGHPLAAAFVKALQSEAAVLRLQLKNHTGQRRP
ncbi:DNA-binding transcriptional LysR family regulator [Paraburkholderia sp. RAU2J]|nr:DNA-binding transcriptional LysR family regulator [Paraburkholderia sp. RAU2J]